VDEVLFNHSGYQAHLDQGQLAGARCTACGKLHLPPRGICPHCFRTDIHWQVLSGEGELEAFSVIHVGLPAAFAPLGGMAAEGHDMKPPYCAGIVRLAEGPAISAQIIGLDANQPEAIEVGMRLKAVFIKPGNGLDKQTFLAFAPLVT
jgi:uncharacterized protein